MPQARHIPVSYNSNPNNQGSLEVRHRRALAVAGVLAGVALIGGAYEASQPTAEEQQIQRIIASPDNIPEGQAMTITASEGVGANQLARQYAAEGHVMDLQRELKHEYPDGLPAGQLTVYEGFIKPDIVEQYESEHSAQQ